MHVILQGSSMRSLLLLIAITLLPGVVSAQQPTESPSYDEWRIIYRDGERIGFERTRYVQTKNTVSIRTNASLDTARPRGGIFLDERATFEVDTSGVIRSFTQRSVLGPGRFIEYSGTVKGEQFIMATSTPGRTTEREFHVPPETRAEIWFQWHLRQHPMPPKSRARFRVFRPGIGTDTTRVEVTSGKWRRVQTPSGQRLNLLPLTLKRSNYGGESQLLYADARGRIVLAEFEHSNVRLIKELAPRSEAQTKAIAQQFDLQLMKIIPTKRTTGFNDEARTADFEVSGAPGLLPMMNHSKRQSARALKDDIIKVSVRAPKLKNVRLHKRVSRDYLKASTILDFHDATISRLAAEFSERATDPGAVAMKLQAATDKLISNRAFSTTTPPASEIARLRKGDCTEHAVMLTALLRAQYIPARVVAGLRYVPGQRGFAAHMWTEAMLNGEWVVLDAMRGDKQPGANYIHVSHSSLVDEQTPLDCFIPLADLMADIKVSVLSGGENTIQTSFARESP